MPELITITTPEQTPNSSVIKETTAVFNREEIPPPVRLTQYDNLPFIAVHLVKGGEDYTVPDGAAVNIRMRKPDGTWVYNPAYGLSTDRHTAFIECTTQMTAAPGQCVPIIEVVVSGRQAGTAYLHFGVDRNPVQEDDVQSTYEGKTIQQLAAAAQDAAESAQDSKDAAASSASAAEISATSAANSKNSAATSASSAASSADDAEESASAAASSASAAASSASSASGSASSAAESAQQAQQAAQDAVPVVSRLVTIPVSSWTGSGSSYQATVSVPGVTADTEVVSVVPYAASASGIDAAIEANAAWTYLSTAVGQIVFHAEAKPTAQIQMTVWIKAMES